MRILVVNTLYHPYFQGGAEKSVQLLCEGFKDAGHEVEVVCMGPSTHRGVVNGIPVHYLRTRNVKGFMKVRGSFAPLRLLWHLIDVYNPFYFWFFRRLFKRYRPDVLFSNNLPGWSVSVWKQAARAGLPVVHTLRDHALLCPRGTMFKKEQRCTRQCITCRLFSFPKKQLSRKVSAVVGISAYILNRHLKHGYFYGNTRSAVIPNSVKQMSVATHAHSAKKGGDVVFGYLGRVSVEKGAGYLVDEFLDLPSSLHVRLLIGGDGDEGYVNEMKVKCKGKPVAFMGRVQAAEFFQEIDVLIVPSLLEESFGRVVIEAWASGLFVLGAESGGITELASCGNIHLFVPERGHLTALMREVALQGRQFNGPQYLSIRERFENRTVAEAYLNLFNEVLS